jgi:hypothetical protein
VTHYVLPAETGHFHSRGLPLGLESPEHQEGEDAPPAPPPAPGAHECPYCHQVGGHDYSITHPADYFPPQPSLE